jgi:hypothetical protein
MLTIELRNVVREYRVGGQTVRALDEINLRLANRTGSDPNPAQRK